MGEGMNAGPLLVEFGRRLHEVGLDAVLIGNAAAALQGAPVTTVDFDFLFRKTPRNLTRLKALARSLRATILRPYYPASDFYRVVRDDDGLQLDFIAIIHGLRSYEGVGKRAAGRPRDLAVLEVLETALEEGTKPPRSARRSDVKAPSCAARARFI